MKEYYKDILIRLAHHSSAIEGNTISLPDTVEIIQNNTIPQNSGQSIREIFEVLNHRDAFQLLESELKADPPLSISLIKSFHKVLTDRLQYDNGQYKESSNAILGTNVETATPEETPFLMEQLVENYNFRVDNATTKKEIIDSIADFHMQFERIHPFSDGNGRTGRMIMNYCLVKNDLPMVIIEKDERGEYFDLLNQQDTDKFTLFMLGKMKDEKEREMKFNNSQSQQVSDQRLEEINYSNFRRDDELEL